MKSIWNSIQFLFATIGAWFGYFMGGYDGFVYALVIFVVLDYLTGVMVAVVNKKLSSEIGFKGICKKILIFILVGVGNVLDVEIIGSGSCLRTAIIFFYLSNEGISLLENASNLGLPIPEKLKDVLAQIKEKSN